MQKKWLLLLSAFHIISSNFPLAGDDSYWNSSLVRGYVHNSDLQRRWAMAFLAPNLKQLSGDERILDIGCGDGKITADISKFIPQGSILGIDPSSPMLDWARKQYSALEYPNLAFWEGGFLEPNINEAFDVIISNCALQHCADQAKAIKNLARLLKREGKLWIMVPAIDNACWKEAGKALRKSPKWAFYWQNYPPRNFLAVQEYEKLLREADLHPLRIEKVQTSDPFVDREEFLSFLLGTFAPAVPADMAKEFYNDLIDEYLRRLPEAINSEGVIETRFGRIEIEAIH